VPDVPDAADAGARIGQQPPDQESPGHGVAEPAPPDQGPLDREPEDWESLGTARALRRVVRGSPGLVVLTGGQTGVDTAAALAALSAGLAVHLVFPRGFLQEDGPITASRRRQLHGALVHELASPEFRDRTWTSVGLSDAVILIDPAGGDGCQETVRAAERFGRPVLSLGQRAGASAGDGLNSGPTPGSELVASGEIASWLNGHGVRVLMIAGCRASLLAGTGAGFELPKHLATIMSGASARHRQLLGAAPAPP
jgi:hypothetical protein